MFSTGADIMWDEIAAAAWIDPSIITKSETRYMSVDIDHGAGYGNTLTWSTSGTHRPETQTGGNPVRSGPREVLPHVRESHEGAYAALSAALALQVANGIQ